MSRGHRNVYRIDAGGAGATGRGARAAGRYRDLPRRRHHHPMGLCAARAARLEREAQAAAGRGRRDTALDGEALINRLPKARGRLEANRGLADLTWFRAGGPAEVLFTPADEADLAQFLAGSTRTIPVTVIGVGSNLLVRDGGVPGVVIRLGRGFAGLEPCGNPDPRRGRGARCPGGALRARSWYRWINLSERYTRHHRRRVADEWRGLWRGDQGCSGRSQGHRPPRGASRACQCRHALHLPSLRRAGGSDLHRGAAAGPAGRPGRHCPAMDEITPAARLDAADQEPHRRLDLQEPARHASPGS